jgi:hypothetical protein
VSGYFELSLTFDEPGSDCILEHSFQKKAADFRHLVTGWNNPVSLHIEDPLGCSLVGRNCGSTQERTHDVRAPSTTSHYFRYEPIDVLRYQAAPLNDVPCN